MYAWCEQSYIFSKVGETGYSVTDVGRADGDDQFNTNWRKIYRILVTISGRNDDGDVSSDGFGDL